MTQSIITHEDDDAIELLTGVEQYSKKLTQWEHGFLESISEQETLSEKQRVRFEEICTRVLC